MADANKSPENDLWRFSLDFYSLPGTASALVALQDRDGLDVNLMLFALWLGTSGRGRLGRDDLTASERTVRDIRTEIVGPLRALRRRLKEHPDKEIQDLREGVKALELAAEKLAQVRLAGPVRPAEAGTIPEARLADAGANLALYLGPQRFASAEATVIRTALEELILRHCGASGALVRPSV